MISVNVVIGYFTLLNVNILGLKIIFVVFNRL